MSNQTVQAATESFISYLYSDENLHEALFTIPEIFIQQGRDAAESFFVDSSLLSKRAYAREDGSNDLIRIVLEEPKLTDEGVIVKFRLSGLMNTESGELRPMAAGNTMADNETWLRGFRSTNVLFTPESVDAGIITEADYAALENYAEMWAEICEEEGTADAMYTSENAKKRLWLVSSNDDALFTFDLVLRQNPNNGDHVVGITNVAFSDLHIIGAGVGQAPLELTKATGVTYAKPTVSLPKLKRAEGRIPQPRKRR
jgi:hypothetical protein